MSWWESGTDTRRHPNPGRNPQASSSAPDKFCSFAPCLEDIEIVLRSRDRNPTRRSWTSVKESYGSGCVLFCTPCSLPAAGESQHKRNTVLRTGTQGGAGRGKRSPTVRGAPGDEGSRHPFILDQTSALLLLVLLLVLVVIIHA